MGLKEAGLRGSLQNVSVGASVIPDSAVFDGWSDNKLTNRDDFDTTPYQYDPLTESGQTANDRAEWSEQRTGEGLIRASNGYLEYSWGTTSPVTVVGARTSFDISEGVTIYQVFEGGTPQGDSLQSSFIFSITPDVTVRNGPSEVKIVFSTEDQIQLKIDGTIIISGSPPIAENTAYGILTERDANGNWSIYFDPTDPENPQAGELVGEAQDPFIPDMSGADSGIYYTTNNGYDTVQTIHRLEVF